MPRNDETPFVDVFAAEGDDSPDEELRYPAPNLRWQRARLPVVVASGLALLAIVVVGVVNGTSRSRPSARPATVTVSPPHSTPRPSTTPTTGAVVACPGEASCTTVLRTPAALSKAIHEIFPAERRLSTLSTFVHADGPGSHLLSRRIRAEAGAAHIDVQVQQGGQRDRIGWNAAETARRTSVIVTHHTGGSLITLRLTAPPGYGPDIPALQRLAADERLLALA